MLRCLSLPIAEFAGSIHSFSELRHKRYSLLLFTKYCTSTTNALTSSQYSQCTNLQHETFSKQPQGTSHKSQVNRKSSNLSLDSEASKLSVIDILKLGAIYHRIYIPSTQTVVNTHQTPFA